LKGCEGSGYSHCVRTGAFVVDTDCPVASEYEGGAILWATGMFGLCMMTVGSSEKEKKEVASLIADTKTEIPRRASRINKRDKVIRNWREMCD